MAQFNRRAPPADGEKQLGWQLIAGFDAAIAQTQLDLSARLMALVMVAVVVVIARGRGVSHNRLVMMPAGAAAGCDHLMPLVIAKRENRALGIDAQQRECCPGQDAHQVGGKIHAHGWQSVACEEYSIRSAAAIIYFTAMAGLGRIPGDCELCGSLLIGQQQ